MVTRLTILAFCCPFIRVQITSRLRFSSLSKVSPESLDFGGEDALLPLLVPFFDPLGGADVSVDVVEVLARLVVVPLHLGATLKVDIVLPTVPENE